MEKLVNKCKERLLTKAKALRREMKIETSGPFLQANFKPGSGRDYLLFPAAQESGVLFLTKKKALMAVSLEGEGGLRC